MRPATSSAARNIKPFLVILAPSPVWSQASAGVAPLRAGARTPPAAGGTGHADRGGR